MRGKVADGFKQTETESTSSRCRSAALTLKRRLNCHGTCHLVVIVSAFNTDIDASGRTACEFEQPGLGISSGFLLRLNARGPQSNDSCTGIGLIALRERRTVTRAGHILADWALFNKPAVVGWTLYRIPTTWTFSKQARGASIVSPREANIQQCRQRFGGAKRAAPK